MTNDIAGNRLGDESSPYLLQHQDNPVHWLPWGDEAFEQARNNEKPILLSIGYAACHWCHVMAHESFESPEIAAVMNEHFVNIKVDREERPDIDSIYMSAVTLMGQHGGWPLTVFLTPDGDPYWGGTYFPPAPRHGHPGFPDVLRTMSEIYHNQKDKMGQNITAIKEALEGISSVPDKGGPGLQSVDQLNGLANDAVRMMDPLRGGTVGAPKFPQPTFLNFFWRAYQRNGQDIHKNAVLTSLVNMCQGGIYDHLGGGFARYSTDEYWLVPHFEKMLYDNAQLVEVMTLAWQTTGDELLAVRIEETIEWVRRDLGLDGGGFAGTLDADSEGVEGKFYVWSADEIDALLGDEADGFKEIYDVSPHGNWEGANILNRSKNLTLGSAADEDRLKACRAKLLPVRDKRIWPGLDDKVLADWNGMMIAALAYAGVTFDRQDWLEAARETFDFVRTNMGDGDRLVHSWRAGNTKGNDVLDDYAQMIRAGLVLYQLTGEATYLDQAKAWLGRLDTQFWDSQDGAYFLTPEDAGGLITRTRNAFDNATPAGNGTMMENLATLYHLTGETVYRDKADRIVDVFTRQPPNQYVNMTSILNGFERLAAAVQVALIGAPDDPEMVPMRSSALGAGHPDLILSQVAPGDELPTAHPAHGKTQVDGRVTAYVCVGTVCGLPVSTPGGLTSALAEI